MKKYPKRAYWKGKKFSKKHKENISKANKNNPACAYWKGKKQSKKSNEKRSKSLKGQTWSWSKPKVTQPLYETYNPQISYAEATRKSGEFIEVKCAYCGKWFIPTIWAIRNRIYSLKGQKGYKGENRLYCSKGCKRQCPIFWQIKYPKDHKPATSREVQPELRQMRFEIDNWTCQKCGSQENLHCHHIEGIRWEPLESADVDKCITVCEDCHKKIHTQNGCGYHDLQCG